jgi:hypothetical protein
MQIIPILAGLMAAVLLVSACQQDSGAYRDGKSHCCRHAGKNNSK